MKNAEVPNQGSSDNRLRNEIGHGRVIAENAGEIWHWGSPAGKRRWSRRVEMLTSHISPGMSVLELGCGTGYYTRELEKTGALITAIDISPDLLNIASSTISSHNVTFRVNNAYAMDFDNELFDTVIGISVLHHLDIEKALSEVYRVVKTGGIVKFSEPNMLNPQIALERNVPALRKMMHNSPDETAFFKWEIRNLLLKAGFKKVSVPPFDFLHPAVPAPLVPFVARLTESLEQIPVLQEIAGSLYIQAKK